MKLHKKVLFSFLLLFFCYQYHTGFGQYGKPSLGLGLEYGIGTNDFNDTLLVSGYEHTSIFLNFPLTGSFYFGGKVGKGTIYKEYRKIRTIRADLDFEYLLPGLSVRPYIGVGVGLIGSRTIDTLNTFNNGFTLSPTLGVFWFISRLALTLNVKSNYHTQPKKDIYHTVNLGARYYFWREEDRIYRGYERRGKPLFGLGVGIHSGVSNKYLGNYLGMHANFIFEPANNSFFRFGLMGYFQLHNNISPEFDPVAADSTHRSTGVRLLFDYRFLRSAITPYIGANFGFDQIKLVYGDNNVTLGKYLAVGPAVGGYWEINEKFGLNARAVYEFLLPKSETIIMKEVNILTGYMTLIFYFY